MPILLLLLAILVLAVVVWVIRMGGIGEFQRKKAQHQEKATREAVRERLRTAHLRTVDDPRDAAAVLMLLLAREEGEATREQIWLIEDKLRSLGVTDDLPERMAKARFIARETESFHLAARVLAILFRNRLTDEERRQLVEMLEEVVRQDPSQSQRDAIAAFRPMIGLVPGFRGA